MLTSILFIAIGFWLKAPLWYFLIIGLHLSAHMIAWGMKLYKAGQDES